MSMHSTPTIDKKTWNSLVHHPMQSWEWGEVKKRVGTPIVRYAYVEDENPTAFLMTMHPVPLLGVMAYCGRSAWPTNKQAQGIYTYLREKGCMMAKFEPALVTEEAGKYQIPLLNRSFTIDHIRYTQSRSTIFAPHTFTLNLAFTKEELLSHMKSKTRYNIGLATRKGVVVRDTTEEPKSLEEFFDLYRQTSTRQRYFGRNRDYMKTLWDELGGTMARIYTAYYQGMPLSSYMIFYFKQGAYYVYGGSSAQHKEVMASNLLMWEAILDAKKRGCTEFDMWGALPLQHNPHNPWAGFHRFKEGFGGRHRTFIPALDMVLDPFKYWLFDVGWPIRNALLGITSRL